MRKSLLWQCFWPLLVTALIAGGITWHHQRHTHQTLTLLQQRMQIQVTLDRSLHGLLEQHNRFVSRVQESILTGDVKRQETTLRWAHDNYTNDLENRIDNITRLIARELALAPPQKVTSDLRRLEQIVLRIREFTATINERITQIYVHLENEDSEGVHLEATRLIQKDRALRASLQIASSTLRRSGGELAKPSNSTEPSLPRSALLLLGWLPLGLFFIHRPLRGLTRLGAASATDAPPRTALEASLVSRFRQQDQRLKEAELALAEHSRGASRAQQGTRRAEHELALLKLYNENLVNNLRAAVIVSNPTGTVTSFNRTARNLLALTPRHQDQPVNQLPFYHALGERIDVEALLPLPSGNDRQRLESLALSIEGEELLIDLSIIPFQDESGASRGLLWVADDVTDAVNLKNQLLAAEHLATVGRMSAQVAHEIRNPLSAIGLNAELLEEEFARYLPKKEGAEAVNLLKAIEHEIERLTQITEGYLQLTKTPNPTYQPLDLNHAVNTLLIMLTAELKKKGIEVHLNLGKPAPLAWADPGQIRQALINIIRNGEEAMSAGGTLRISTRQEKATCQLEVSDTGSGIPELIQGRVFEPFYTTKSNGTGLGLSLTEQIISEHGGTIVLHSPPGEGTTVTIEVPTAP